MGINQRCPIPLKAADKKLDKTAELSPIGIPASPSTWRKLVTSVPPDDEANLRAGRPKVKKDMSCTAPGPTL